MKLYSECVLFGTIAYAITSLPVFFGVSFGFEYLTARSDSNPPDIGRACCRFDGNHYIDIVENGYSYDPSRRSTVAFFPGYPLLGWIVREVTGLSASTSLLLVSNLALLGAFVIFAAYVRVAWLNSTALDRCIVLGLFGTCPAGFFLRMAYSESLFVCVSLIFLLGLRLRWPLIALALLAGLVTAIRSVGVIAPVALGCYILSDRSRGSLLIRCTETALWFPLACWGLFAYMSYQEYQFNNALAFAQAQDHWQLGHPRDYSFFGKVRALAIGEPIWNAYIPETSRYWGRLDHHSNPLFNLFFWNPILFVGAFALVMYGVVRSWLSGPEIVFGFGLLAIPYLMRAYEMSMASHARFASAVIPAYVVFARLIHCLPVTGIWAILTSAAMLLVAWSALFAAGHNFF